MSIKCDAKGDAGQEKHSERQETEHTVERMYLLDSGASDSCTGNARNITQPEEINCEIQLGDGRSIDAAQRGLSLLDVRAENLETGKTQMLRLHHKDVVYSKFLRTASSRDMVLSVHKFTDNRFRVIFDADGSFIIHKPTGLAIRLVCQSACWYVPCEIVQHSGGGQGSTNFVPGPDRKHRKVCWRHVVARPKLYRVYEVHETYGHVCGDSLRAICSSNGIDCSKREIYAATQACEACARVKMRRPDRVQTVADVRYESPGQGYSLDLIYVKQQEGKKSPIVLSKDSKSAFLRANILKAKPDVLQHIRELVDVGIAYNAMPPTQIHSDPEQVLKSREIEIYCKSQGVLRTYAPPGEHSKNGRLEAEVRPLKHLLAIHAIQCDELPVTALLSENLQHAILLRNVTPRKKLKMKSAWEVEYASQPEMLRLLPLLKRKLFPWGTKCIFYKEQ